VRLIFLLLVLANLAFFTWSRFGAPEAAASDPAPAGRQVEPDRLVILLATTTVAEKRGGSASGASAAADGAPDRLACLEWGSFAVADAPRAQEVLAVLNAGTRLSERRADEVAGWWVYLAPQGSRPAAQKKAAELKALGIEDYFILQDEGPQRWALSLGVFRSEDAAQARLNTLRERGVKTALVGPRETRVEKVWLQLASASPAEAALVRAEARKMAGTEVRACPSVAATPGIPVPTVPGQSPAERRDAPSPPGRPAAQSTPDESPAAAIRPR
jgi:hypothetical protein